MRLILHPGYPKTATTWLQTHALPQAGVMLLGKGSAGDGSEDRWDTAVTDLHYRVFSSVYGPGRIWERFRDAVPALREYAGAIAGRLEQDSEAEIAVLSDETMLAYGGAEINAGPFAYFLAAVRSAVAEPERLSCELVLTIREQASYLQSFFAYVYTLQRKRFRDFGSFLEAGLTSPHDDVFGYLFYDDVVDFLETTLPACVRVRVVPYELLAAKGAVAFVDAFLGPDASGHALRVDERAGSTMVNPSERGYPLRDLAGRSRLVRPRRSQVHAELSGEHATRLRELYAEDNRRLAARFDLDLAGLGYGL